MVNKATLIGRLGKDPEVRYTQGGATITSFSLATDEQWKDKSGQKQQKTEWHNIVVFGKLAEICGQYLTKGQLVYIEGRIATRSWESGGTKRYTTEINATDMKMLTKGEAAPQREAYAAQDNRPLPEDNSDLPF